MELPSPTDLLASRKEVFLAYLDFFRSRLSAKVRSLPPDAARTSLLPSGWSPVELAKHLTYVERRWLVWGFEGEDVGDPWGDQRDGRWHAGDDEPTEMLLAALAEQGLTTRRVVESHELGEVGRPGPRWAGSEPATLERVLFHLLQEYARHLGHLDVVAELAGGERDE